MRNLDDLGKHIDKHSIGHRWFKQYYFVIHDLRTLHC